MSGISGWYNPYEKDLPESSLRQKYLMKSGIPLYTAENFTIHACTDVTGFGLLGHCGEMAAASGAVIEIGVKGVAFMQDAEEYARMG